MQDNLMTKNNMVRPLSALGDGRLDPTIIDLRWSNVFANNSLSFSVRRIWTLRLVVWIFNVIF